MIDEARGAQPWLRWARDLTLADAAFVGLAVLLSGAGSVWLGQDLNFDLLSYHYYNGYAFVGGRLDRDIAPTGWHTYISPAMDALSYLGMVALPVRVFGFLFGALHGVNVALVYLLAVALLLPGEPRTSRLLAGMAASVAGLGPNAVSLLGTTMGNNLVSLPVLGALLVLLWPCADGRSPLAAGAWSNARLLATGALCGAATGLRLTAAGDHLAVCLVAAAFTARLRSPRALLAACSALGLGSVLGFLAVNGLWSAQLLQRFGNPLFPFANQVFRSPFFEEQFLRDPRWIARDVWDCLRPPLDIAVGRMDRLQEIGARDARYLAIVAAGLGVVVTALVTRRGWRSLLHASSLGSLVLGYWLVGYVLWIAVFYYYRYMTTLEFVAPLALLVLLRRLVPARALVPAVLVVSLALVAWSRTDSWGRGDWRPNWFGLNLPALAQKPDALVLLAGAPVSFALPDFPRDARFAHLTAIRDIGGTELFDEMILEALRRHQGPLLLLARFRVDKRAQDPATRRPRWRYNPEEDVGPAAKRFGLALTDRCEDMRTRRGPLYLCEVERTVATTK